jgi:pyruvoyl-dependent arginine decarboxylase (PvlArgDC)
VTLDQVKEKFGTLRFYYTGGDEHISGMVRMAESMSAVTCESCGNPGEQTRGGWIKTTCKPCEDKRAAEYARQTAEYETKKETKNELNYQFISEDTGDHD